MVRTMAVPLFLRRIDRLFTVLGRVPACFEELPFILAFLVQRLAHLGEDFGICSTLHREHLSLIVIS